MSEQKKWTSADEAFGVQYTEEYKAQLKIQRDFFDKIAPEMDERLQQMKSQIYQRLQKDWFLFPFNAKNHTAQLKMTFDEMLADETFREIVRDSFVDSFQISAEDDDDVINVDYDKMHEIVVLPKK
jgi:hypothetical protein